MERKIDMYLLKIYAEQYQAVVQMIKEYEGDLANGEKFTSVKTEIYNGLFKAKQRLHKNMKDLLK